MAERWFGCPLCGRSARKLRELTALGCEGQHVELMPASDVEPLVEAAKQALDLFEGPEHSAAEALMDALKPFEDQ
jgi:hypothetical protein